MLLLWRILEKRKGRSRPPYGTSPRSLLSTPSTALPSVDPNTRRFYSSLLLVLAGRELDHSRAILWILAPYRSSSTIEPRSRSVELRCGLSRETVGFSGSVCNRPAVLQTSRSLASQDPVPLCMTTAPTSGYGVCNSE